MDIQVDRANHTVASLRWTAIPEATVYRIHIEEESVFCQERGSFEVSVCTFKAPFPLKAGHTYIFTITAFQEAGGLTLREEAVTVRAEFTKAELGELFDKATTYVKSNMNGHYETITWLYRNKPKEYFTDITTNHNNVMKVYKKDCNGDQASLINGQISGLFFASFLDNRTRQPPATSIFGEERIYVPAAVVLRDLPVKLYFADFYCNHSWHYVTVVQTTPGSETDDFCAKNLIELNVEMNDFIYATSQSGVRAAKRAHIELFYTDDLDIPKWEQNHGAYRECVPSSGTSRPGGLPKRASCSVCNLDMLNVTEGASSGRPSFVPRARFTNFRPFYSDDLDVGSDSDSDYDY